MSRETYKVSDRSWKSIDFLVSFIGSADWKDHYSSSSDQGGITFILSRSLPNVKGKTRSAVLKGDTQTWSASL